MATAYMTDMHMSCTLYLQVVYYCKKIVFADFGILHNTYNTSIEQ